MYVFLLSNHVLRICIQKQTHNAGSVIRLTKNNSFEMVLLMIQLHSSVTILSLKQLTQSVIAVMTRWRACYLYINNVYLEIKLISCTEGSWDSNQCDWLVVELWPINLKAFSVFFIIIIHSFKINTFREDIKIIFSFLHSYCSATPISFGVKFTNGLLLQIFQKQRE